jgi:cytochrome c oxidase subunit 2
MKLSPRQIVLSLVSGFVLTLLGAFWAVQLVRTPPTHDVVDPMRLNLSEFRDLGLYKVDDTSYLLRVVAKQWVFNIGQRRDTPAIIHIPAGSTLQIVATSMDIMHTIQISGYDPQYASPGTVSRITYSFDQPGTYLALCSEYCGPKHHEMTLSIVVLPAP